MSWKSFWKRIQKINRNPKVSANYGNPAKIPLNQLAAFIYFNQVWIIYIKQLIRKMSQKSDNFYRHTWISSVKYQNTGQYWHIEAPFLNSHHSVISDLLFWCLSNGNNWNWTKSVLRCPKIQTSLNMVSWLCTGDQSRGKLLFGSSCWLWLRGSNQYWSIIFASRNTRTTSSPGIRLTVFFNQSWFICHL